MADFVQEQVAEGIVRRTYSSGRVSYRATAAWRDGAGRRQQPSQTSGTLKEAKVWRAQQVADQARNIKRPTGRLTLGAYLVDWIEEAQRRRPGNTTACYRHSLKKLEGHPILKRRLNSLNLKFVSGAYDAIERKDVPRVHEALHRALADAVPDLLGWNPATGAERAFLNGRGDSVEPKERPVWTADEVTAFLKSAITDRFYALWVLLVRAGLRRGEALGLDWTDVDFANGALTVRRQYTTSDGRLVLKEVKTKRSRRPIDLGADTIAVLREWQKQQRATSATRIGERDARAVFTTVGGYRLAPGYDLDQRFLTLKKAAKVRADVTIHDVRHTHATLLLMRGVPVNVVSERLGHANEAITLNVYAHVMPGQGRAAADIADSIG